MVSREDFRNREFGSAKIGVFGCGHWKYWEQFEGLKERLIGHQSFFEERLRDEGFDVLSGGLSDNPSDSQAYW